MSATKGSIYRLTDPQAGPLAPNPLFRVSETIRLGLRPLYPTSRPSITRRDGLTAIVTGKESGNVTHTGKMTGISGTGNTGSAIGTCTPKDAMQDIMDTPDDRLATPHLLQVPLDTRRSIIYL